MIKWNLQNQHFVFDNISTDELKKIAAWFCEQPLEEGCSKVMAHAIYTDIKNEPEYIHTMINPDGNTVTVFHDEGTFKLTIHSLPHNGAVLVWIGHMNSRRKYAIAPTIIQTWQFNELVENY